MKTSTKLLVGAGVGAGVGAALAVYAPPCDVQHGILWDSKTTHTASGGEVVRSAVIGAAVGGVAGVLLLPDD